MLQRSEILLNFQLFRHVETKVEVGRTLRGGISSTWEKKRLILFFPCVRKPYLTFRQMSGEKHPGMSISSKEKVFQQLPFLLPMRPVLSFSCTFHFRALTQFGSALEKMTNWKDINIIFHGIHISFSWEIWGLIFVSDLQPLVHNSRTTHTNIINSLWLE